jgi:hypothetical protein
MATVQQQLTDDERRLFDARIRAHNETEPGYGQAWKELSELLLAVGGTAVVPPLDSDRVLVAMIKVAGAAVPEATRIVVRAGSRSDCHRNAVASWRGGGAVAIGTGYALSQDAFWRGHSWAWAADGSLIETTDPRIRYFGIRLADEGAEVWAELFGL